MEKGVNFRLAYVTQDTYPQEDRWGICGCVSMTEGKGQEVVVERVMTESRCSIPLANLSDKKTNCLKELIAILMIPVLTLTSMTVVVVFSKQVSAYTPHDWISIDGDADFTPANGVTGGNGTWDDPYIIEGWEIAPLYSPAILIKNTDAHFIVRNVYVHPGGSQPVGVNMRNVSNGAIENSTLTVSYIGVNQARDINVTYNTISGSTIN